MIAVDGFSSCGKSTFAREIAARLGYIFIDTGAMYRAVTLCGLRAGVVSPQGIDRAGLEALLDRIDISFRFNPARGASDIYVNGECVEREIRSIEVSGCVSAVSGVAEVRRRLVALQQAMGRDKGIVMDGRDIGTVVFPDAELKIFMTADPSVRPGAVTTNCGPRANGSRWRRWRRISEAATSPTRAGRSARCGGLRTPWCSTTAG